MNFIYQFGRQMSPERKAATIARLERERLRRLGYIHLRVVAKSGNILMPKPTRSPK